MSKIAKLLMLMLTCIMASCINSNLDDIESYTDSKITDINFEYRWVTGDQLHVKSLNVAKSVDATTNTVECTITVPKADNTFTEEIRNGVTLSNICGYMTLSTGATLKPVGNAPNMGIIADFSGKEYNYEVIAADGTKSAWKLKINDFKK